MAHEIDEQTYRDYLNDLKYGGPIRVTTGCNQAGKRIPNVMWEWMIRQGDAEQFTAWDGHDWVRAKAEANAP